MAIKLIGGPLDGIMHEMRRAPEPLRRAGISMPGEFALANEDRTERYWYAVNPNRATARYLRTEQLHTAEDHRR